MELYEASSMLIYIYIYIYIYIDIEKNICATYIKFYNNECKTYFYE